MKEPYQSATHCAYELCKRADPVEITPGHRRKLYHDDTCRQAQHRLLAARGTQEILRQMWATYLPETQQALEELLEEHGEAWTRRVIAAIIDERDQARQPRLSEEERAAIQAHYADFQPFTRNILDALLREPHDTLSLLNLVLLAIGEEQRHANCNSVLEQRAAYLEIALAEYRRIVDLEDREKTRQQFMAVGQSLGYRAVPKFQVGEGQNHWEDYASWTDDRTLAEVILFGREVLIEEEAARTCAQERNQLRQVERQLAQERTRREELERQLETVASSTEKSQQTPDLEKDLAAVCLNVAGPDLLATAYGRALLLVKEREREIQHLQTRIEKQYERRIAKQQRRIQELEAERVEWVAWREAEIIAHSRLAAMRQYLRDHEQASIPIKRNGVVMRIWTIGEDAVAFSDDHGLVRLSDEEIEQGRIWVCKKNGTPIIAFRQPIGGGKHDRESGNE